MYLTRQKMRDSKNRGADGGKNRYPNTRLLLIQLTIPRCSLKLNNNKLRIDYCPEGR